MSEAQIRYNYTGSFSKAERKRLKKHFRKLDKRLGK